MDLKNFAALRSRLWCMCLAAAMACAAETGVPYVSSRTCAACHPAIAASFRKTHMGRSLDVAEKDPALMALTKPVRVYNRALNRYFEVRPKGARFVQSEYELDSQGKEVFRATHQLKYAIGSGMNGVGYLVERDHYLVEAPLTWYSRTSTWDLSPGYQASDRGFSRLIESGCISCHSGRAAVTLNRPGLFGEPAFAEMSIGCENCHGPGALHVRERGSGHVAAPAGNTIVNPARLPPRLAEQICLNCHQDGHVRVFEPGKQQADFRPGMYSAQIYALFDVPPKRNQSPEPDSHQYGFEMEMSKCYRASGGALSCLTCHNPHEEPTGARAASWFREKCLTCHSNDSCTAPHAARSATQPADNCVTCHMPKKEWFAPHSSTSEHRILRTLGEEYPEEAWHQTTAELPDVVFLNRPPAESKVTPSSDVLVEAYGILSQSFPIYEAPLLRLLLPRITARPMNGPLLASAAREAGRGEEQESVRKAIALMQRAIAAGSADSAPFLSLAAWLQHEQSFGEAAAILEQAQRQFPMDRAVGRLLIDAEALAGRELERETALRRHLQLFPEDTDRFTAP